MNTDKSKYNINYSQEMKDSMIKRMLSPERISAKDLALETGISRTSLNKWLKNASPKMSSKSKSKFHIVMETYGLNESELSTYARENGLYVKEIKDWQAACEKANETEYIPVSELKQELADEKKNNKKLEKELRYKEKALVEAAAILVLSKKIEAIWIEKEEE